MKILISTDRYKHNISGVTTAILTLTDELRQRGHEVKILTLSDTKQSYKEGDDYYISSFHIHFYPDARYSFRFHDPLIQELIAWKPDLVHIQTEFASKHLVMQIIRHTHCPCVYSSHTMYEEYVRRSTANVFSLRWYILPKYHLLYRNASAIIVPSKKMKKVMRSYHIHRPMIVIPTGIDLNRYQQRLEPEQRKRLLQSLKLTEQNPILVVLSRLSKEKNIEELIDYMPGLIRQNNSIRLLIVGDGPYKKHLLRKVKKQNLTEYVLFTGSVSPKYVYRYYQLGSVYVCASTFESQGLTYGEALASGLPLVCRKDPCLTPVLTHGSNGYIYETEEEYDSYIMKLISNPELRQSMGEESFRKSFDINCIKYGDRMERLYQRVIDHYQ